MKSKGEEHILMKSKANKQKLVKVDVFRRRQANIVFLICLSFGIALCSLLYKLQKEYIICSVIITICMIPSLLKINYKKIFENKKLQDASTYIEMMIYSFKKKPKILESLYDTSSLFEDGRMKRSIEEAIQFMDQEYFESESDANSAEQSLQIIYDAYPNNLIQQIHQYFIKVEQLGGTYQSTLQALLTDKKLWLNRCLEHKKDCETWRRNIIIAIMLSLLICSCTLYLLPQDVAIQEIFIYQISSILSFLGYYIVYIKMEKKVFHDYVTSTQIESDGKLLERCKRMKKHENKRNPGFSIGYAINKKIVTKANNQAFSEWLLEIGLLLQTENVQTAIAKSYDRAPVVLKAEIELLMERLIENPRAVEPYTQFLAKYNNAEVVFAMQLLYSLSVNNTGDAEKQIVEIIEQSNFLRNKTEIQNNELRLAGMNILFLMPIVIAGIKMLVDMTLFMMVFLKQAQL